MYKDSTPDASFHTHGSSHYRSPNGDRVSSLTGMVGYAPTRSVSKTDALLLRYIPKQTFF